MTRLTVPAAAFALLMPVAAAAGPAEVDRLIDAMGMEAIIGIMAEEGLGAASEMAAEMAPGGLGPDWQQQIARIYDVPRMQAAYAERLHAELDESDIDALLVFLESPAGQRAVGLEIEARRAMIDESVTEGARARAMQAFNADTPLSLQITDFIEVNDLIDRNVEGALNSNFAFLAALDEAGGLGMAMTEADLLREVWSGEPDLRSETIDWLRAYLLMAYGPLEEGDLEAYIAASDTAAGREAVRGSFAAFDALFRQQSRALGLAVAAQVAGSDL